MKRGDEDKEKLEEHKINIAAGCPLKLNNMNHSLLSVL